MCNVFSGYATSTGDIFCDPAFTHSHSLVAKIHNLNDDDVSFYRKTLAKYEFRPPDDTKLWPDMSKWTLVVDENETPDWFDREKVRAHMEAMVSSMFVRDARGILTGGCWIFDGPEASAKGVIGGTVAGVINGAKLENALLERGGSQRGEPRQGEPQRGVPQREYQAS